MLANIEILYLGALVLLLLGLLFCFSEKSKQKKIRKLIAAKHLSKLIPSFSKTRSRTKLILLLVSFVILFFALARPQWGSKQRTTAPRGIDILIAVDVSKSMLARDVKPNRLERVKLGIRNLREKVRSDRLGLIAFSGSSFLQCPLTLDHQAFLKTLEGLHTEIIKTPGTDLALPIEEASKSFAKDDNDRFLIILSDGEDLEGEGLKRAKLAHKEGIKIYTIGVGSPEGSFITTDPSHMPAKNFLKARSGKMIITKTDPTSLENIAKATRGKYFHLGPTGEGLAKVFEILQSIGHKRKKEQLSTELPIERFQPFILIALLLLVLESVIPNARKYARRLALGLIALFLLPCCIKQDNIQRAEEEVKKGNHARAAEFYALEINATTNHPKDEDLRLSLNAGLAYLEAGMLDKAETFLDRSLDLTDQDLVAIAQNALGNVYYKKANECLDRQDVTQAREAWDKALSFYEESYKLNENDKASSNLNSLKNQIEKRINALVSKIRGKIWRDINGDGLIQKSEPGLQGIIFWDKDNNGELNATLEPQIPSTKEGDFAFEWITGNYSANTTISIASRLTDKNQSGSQFLVPLFPAPPPPFHSLHAKNHQIKLEKPGSYDLPLPYRAAPVIRGNIWADKNANGSLDRNESGYPSASVFLDKNRNFKLDENETSFKPTQDGKFRFPVSPGKHRVLIQPGNPDANITYPSKPNKAYEIELYFESQSNELKFGVFDNSDQQNESESPSENDSNPDDQNEQQSDQQEDQQNEASPTQEPKEVNALYERLLQETESKSEPLEQARRPARIPNNGRDY
jgi:Ca-activated chloride channel family protein